MRIQIWNTLGQGSLSSWLRDQARTLLVVVSAVFVSNLRANAQGQPIHASVSFGSSIEVTATQPFMNSIAVADFDLDGRQDVVVVSDLVAWYRNNGNGTFGQQQVISSALASPFSVFAADLDNDGRPDVMAASLNDSQVAWFRNDGGGGTLFGGIRVVSTIAMGAFSVSAADLDGDGLRDILSTSVYDKKTAWYRNLGGGNFGSPTTNQNVISTTLSSPASTQTADLDGDGIPDLVVTSSGRLSWFKGSRPAGIPQFTHYVISSTQTGMPAGSIADVDGDGWMDLVCVAPTINSVTWFRNRTHDVGAVAPFFGPEQLISNIAEGGRSVAAADLDSDGKPEVTVASLLGNKVIWYQNLGGGDFGWNVAAPAANQKFVTANSPSAVAVATADFNQDGTRDVVAASQADGKVTVFLNFGGQCAMASSNTASASMLAGSRDDLLRIPVSNRGLPGDNNAKISSLTLLFEKSPGVVMTSSEVNSLIESLHLFVDSNNSGSLEFGTDGAVGTVDELLLTAGHLTFVPQPGNVADLAIAPGTTRNFFVVARIGVNAAALNPNTFRVTHISQGSGRSVITDAVSGAALTVEPAVNPDTPSSLVTIQQPHTYTDWSIIHFDAAVGPGTGPTESQFADGVFNLLKYAFVVDPLVNNGAVSLPQISATGGTKVFRHYKPAWATDLNYQYEISRNMLSWGPAVSGVDYQQTDTQLPNGVVQRDLVILGAWTRSYMRAQVTLTN